MIIYKVVEKYWQYEGYEDNEGHEVRDIVQIFATPEKALNKAKEIRASIGNERIEILVLVEDIE